MDESKLILNEDNTKAVYEAAETLLNAVETAVTPQLAEAEEGDRPLIVASPLFRGLFEQMKHRYRNEMPAAATVLVVATILRNFAHSDGLSEIGLADAVTDFLKLMASQSQQKDVTVQ